jgi:large subunit ribosomal protein L3
MRTGLIGKKIGSSSYFGENGEMTSITLVKIDECIVSGIKTKDKNGYNALQIASVEDNLKMSNVNKAQRKLFTSIKTNPKRYLKEFRIDENNFYKIGTKIDVSHFEKGQLIDVSGTSIGKGFAGSMKRHNFSGGRASHGVSVSHRSHGSTGNSQDPGRVFKGKKMAGHMGAKKVTKQNLKIVDIDKENSLLIIKGSIPGKSNSIVLIKDAIKIKRS